MRRKSISIICTVIFAALSILGITLLTSSENESQIKINGIPNDVEGMPGFSSDGDGPLVRMTTEAELQKQNDSLDPITGQPTYKLPVEVKISEDDEEFQQVETCVLTCVIDDETLYDFTFKYVMKDGKKLLVTKGEIFEAFKIPNSDEYAIDCNGLIYRLNLDENKLEMYNSKYVEGYSFYTYNTTNYRKVWAGKPSFNPSGTKMLYYTERATDEVGSIWVMDNVTKTEKPIPNTTGFIRVLQWVNDDIAYVINPYEVIRIDVKNYTVALVYTENGNTISRAVLSYPYMFITDRKNGTSITNLDDGSIRYYDDTRYSYCVSARNGIEHKVLLVYSMPKENNDYYCEAVVLDLETGKDSVITVNEKDSIGVFLPYNDEKAKLDVYIDSGMCNQVSYFIEYSSLQFD
jgi:hypothetical protein